MISFDAASSGNTTGLSLTVSHTVGTGKNRILLVSLGIRTNPVTGDEVTFNGVALTRYDVQYPVVGYQALWYLINPDSGTHDIVSTSVASVNHVQASASYFGVDQVSPIDVGGKTTSDSASTLSQSLITTAINDWIFASGIDNTETQTAASGSTQRATTALNIVSGIYDNNVSLNPAGTYSIGFDLSGAQSCGIIAFALKPAALPPKVMLI